VVVIAKLPLPRALAADGAAVARRIDSASMAQQPEPADRVKPPYDAADRALLDGWLDFHRRTLLWKCEGLTDDQLRSRPIPPSDLSLIGLVRHMA
jgi:hypothetical protein